MDRAEAGTARVWLGGAPLDARIAELTGAGLSRVDALLHLLEWTIRRRPAEEIELLRSVVEPHVSDMALDVLSDLRWLQAFAALRTGHYGSALSALVPLSHFDRSIDRPLGPHERGPQVLASVLVAQTFREVGALTRAGEEAARALDWIGDLGATDFTSCAVTAGRLWRGAHLLGFELEAGLAEDALAAGDLSRARAHAVAARRWLPRRALDSSPDNPNSGNPSSGNPSSGNPSSGNPNSTVPWHHRVTLLLLWSKLSLARGWSRAAVRSAEFAFQLAERHQALPDMARCWYQHGLALLGTPFDPIRYLLDFDSRQPVHLPMKAAYSLERAAATAENAGMAQLACAAHFDLGALFAPRDRKMTLLHIDRAMDTAEQIAATLLPELVPWWELSRMATLRLAHVIVHDIPGDHQVWGHATTPADTAPPVSDRDESEETQAMQQGLDDIPQPPDLEGELRAALHGLGYALADENGAGAVITPAQDQVGLLVGWQSSADLGAIQASVSSALVMKGLGHVLETLGFLARCYERDPDRLIVKGTYSPMLDADDADDGDRAECWYESETRARHLQLGWLADTRVYDVTAMQPGVAGHPLRDLVVQILVALDGAGLPLQVDWPNEGFGDDIGLAVYPHETDGSYVMVSWEPSGGGGEYQREVFRSASRTLIERVLNAAGIVTNGYVTDGSVYVFAKVQELSTQPTESRR